MIEDQDAASPAPVVLVHGWAGSFATTWERSGFTALLADVDRDVIGVDLLGHGTAPKPHDPDAYADLTARVFAAMPDRPVDAVGFSLGALTLLRAAMAQPHRFRKLVLAGIGRNVFERDDESTARIIEAIESGTTDHSVDNRARLFAQYAHQTGNDPVALAALARELKTLCGSGGTVADGVVEIQGDHVERVMQALQAKGLAVKRTGS